MPPTTNTRKRKQTEDMTDPTPPKRVTRARAAKTSEEPAKPTKTTKATKITTASARAATAAKAAPSKSTRAATTKRTTRTAQTDEIPEPVPEPATEEDIEEPVKPAPKARGRPKKVVEQEPEAPAPKTRTRQVKAAEKPATSTTARTIKGRKATKTAAEQDEPEIAEFKPTVSRKTTRGRAAATATKADPAPTKKPATRKKVAFEEADEADKENIPAPVETLKKSSTRASGLRAKPIRKPAGATATRAIRGRAATTKQSGTTASASKPLSPKKATQVAKSSTSGSEDELCGSSPVKALSKSPIKAPGRAWNQSPVKKTSQREGSSSPTPPSPSKNPINLIASPAKRPAQSSSTNTLKESPKKFNIISSAMKPRLDAPQQSPFKDALKASPKRVNLSSSVPQPQFNALSQASSKQSFLQSPARRPASPFKTSAFTSPTKAIEDPFSTTSPSKGANLLQMPAKTPRKLFQSPVRPARMEEQSAKAHNMTPGEQVAMRSREGSPSPIRRTPAKVDAEELAEATSSPSPSSSPSPEDSIIEPEPPRFPSYRSPAVDYDSEDELESGPITMSPSRARQVAVKDFALDTPVANGVIAPKSVEALSMTPLALQMSTWAASSPEKKATELEPTKLEVPGARGAPTPRESPFKALQFDDQMFMYEQEPMTILEDEDLHQTDIHEDVDAMDVDSEGPLSHPLSEEQPVHESQEPEEYGDENAAPVDPLIIFAPVSQSTTSTESQPQTDEAVHTPVQMPHLRNKEIHTVSKVPLRASDDGESPIKVARKRAKSISAPLAEVSGISQPFLPRKPSTLSNTIGGEVLANVSPRKVSFETEVINQLLTPAKDGASAAESPFKSVRKGADARILRGAVVHVDVHTSEGADASGVFIELLQAMGAKCVKQWTWNPRASAADQTATPGGKVGITHVVYKDGGKRTLQKVREAKGLVLCVGVGWVLDCERENTWLNEADYAVDTSTIPRGGHNRRKSMEPTRFSNFNGNLVPATEQQTPGRINVQSPTKEFLSFSAESRRSSIHPLGELPTLDLQPEPPATPSPNMDFDFDNMGEESAWGSPTTPYFLSKGAQLVQMTCPPKQTMQSLFPVSGRIEDHPDEAVRKRLLDARRKSLQWAPKIGSPLGRFGSDE